MQSHAWQEQECIKVFGGKTKYREDLKDMGIEGFLTLTLRLPN
jgi:hypothetical protein